MFRRIVPPATIRRLTLGCAAVLSFALGSIWVVARAQTAPPPQAAATPGAQSDGSVLLSNGWRVAPTGRSIPVGPLPLSIVVSPDGKYAVVSSNGIAKPSLTIL